MKYLTILALISTFSCQQKIQGSFVSTETSREAASSGGGGAFDPFGPPDQGGPKNQDPANGGGTAGGGNTGGGAGNPAPNPPGANDGYALGSGCQGVEGDYCRGGYDNDSNAKSLLVNVIYASPAGTKLTNNATAHAENFLNKMNAYYEFNNHRHMDLKLNEAIEVPQESDAALISKYAQNGYYTMILVQSIPGATAGYVRHMCAELEKGQGWTVMEFPLVAAGVVEHEANHSFCFPHTSSQNGGNPRVFLSGYNPLKSVLAQRQGLKKDFLYPFKIYVDAQNRSNASVTQGGMIYNTHNLMYYSVLRDRPDLFTTGSTGYHHSYSHTLDYYYWNFIKLHAK